MGVVEVVLVPVVTTVESPATSVVVQTIWPRTAGVTVPSVTSVVSLVTSLETVQTALRRRFATSVTSLATSLEIVQTERKKVVEG